MTTQADIDAEWIRRRGLHEFVRRAWPHVEKSQPFVDNWHIGLVCRHLEAWMHGEIRDLLLLMPPGTMKSLLTGVFLPAYEAYLKGGKSATLSASFDGKLTERDSGKCKDLIDSPWYQALCKSQVKIDRKSSKPCGVTEWHLTGGGFMFATSIGGKATGRHGDFLRVDDPHKPKNVDKKELEDSKEWFQTTWASRRKDPKTTRRLVVMQRLAEDDMAGMCMDAGGWVVVCLPMEFDPDLACNTRWGKDPRTTEGELLWPLRYPEEEVRKLKGPNGLGLVGYTTQYQQRPAPKGGAVFHAEWLEHYYDVLPEQGMSWLQSWDMRFKDDLTTGDMVVGAVWARKGGLYYRVDEYRGRWSFTETIAQMELATKRYPKAVLKLVENKANGPAVVSALKKKLPGFVLCEPDGGKVERANAVTPIFESGNVLLPRDAPWLVDYQQELTRFPRARFDDRVDETSQALKRMHLQNTSDLFLKAYGQKT